MRAAFSFSQVIGIERKPLKPGFQDSVRGYIVRGWFGADLVARRRILAGHNNKAISFQGLDLNLPWKVTAEAIPEAARTQNTRRWCSAGSGHVRSYPGTTPYLPAVPVALLSRQRRLCYQETVSSPARSSCVPRLVSRFVVSLRQLLPHDSSSIRRPGGLETKSPSSPDGGLTVCLRDLVRLISGADGASCIRVPRTPMCSESTAGGLR